MRASKNKTEYACIVKCEQVKTLNERFCAVRQPQARRAPSRRLAKTRVRNYATVAEYNKPLLRVSYRFAYRSAVYGVLRGNRFVLGVCLRQFENSSHASQFLLHILHSNTKKLNTPA